MIIGQHWESSFASELRATNDYGFACSSGNIKFSRIGFTDLKDTGTFETYTYIYTHTYIHLHVHIHIYIKVYTYKNKSTVHRSVIMYKILH